MARIARVAAETNIFHVMVQGLAKERIFETEDIKENYLYNLRAYKDEEGVKILAYCVMPNHCHLLLHVPSVERMAHFMKRVNTRFAQYYNFKKERVGYVFRDRYKSQPIFDTSYLTNCLVYIHNNPFKAGIVSNAYSYQYSSLLDYINGYGLVDFKIAGEYYDTSKENIMAIMEELSVPNGCPEWIDVKEESSKIEDKAYEILSGYNMPPKMIRLDREMFVECCTRLHDVGMTYDQIASVFGVANKSTICKLIK